MSLPSGYTRLEYIESTGTQYIDTGFMATNLSRIVIDFTYLGGDVVFGAYNTGGAGAVGMQNLSGSWYQYYGSSGGVTSVAAAVNKRYKADYNQNVATINGVVGRTAAANSFTGTNPVILFGIQNAGTVGFLSKLKLYECKIYENGVLSRSFIPVKTKSGAIGLYDEVSSSFYPNAGAGTFTAGPAYLGNHKALVNGTVYEVKGGKCLVNGTSYDIKKGRTLIGGTGYDITLPGIGTRVSTLSVGQSVYAKVNGAAKEFIVVHQGKPSSLYDDSCNGTWLLMKDIYEDRQWNSSNVNKLESSTIHSYLNGTFLSLFDSNIRDAIKQVKLPYRKNGGSGGTNQSGANGLSTKIFLLSGYEVGFTTSDDQYFPQDGAKLSYFESGTGTSANNKRIAYLNGSDAKWWLRSPSTNSTGSVKLVLLGGRYGFGVAKFSVGIRPALILRSDALVDNEFNIIS